MLESLVRLFLNIGMLFIFIFTCIHYQTKAQSITEEIKFKQWEIRSIAEKLDHIKREIKRTITEDTIATQIIFSSGKEDFILLFDFIDDEYDLRTYNFDIKDSQKINIYKNSQFYDVLKTEISVNFETDSQLKLYAFLEEIISKIPGYVHVKTLDFIKNGRKIQGFFTLTVYTLKPRS